jgi:hypothetical protein
MQIRRGTLTAWGNASNPVLEPGELGFVTDVGKTAFKIGDGATGWNTLPYVNSTYPELDVSAGNNLDTSLAQGRYPLLNASTYTNDPSEFSGGATDGDSVLMVTVPASGIVIQELTTSKTSKRWIRGKNAGTWSAWQRLHGVIATDSLTVVNLTATGTVVANQLGVGVSNPAAKMHVAINNPPNGVVAVVQNTASSGQTGSLIQFNQNAINDWSIGQPSATDAFAFWSGRSTSAAGTEIVRLTSTALASTVNVTAPSIQAGATGLTSSGGLTVSGGSGSSLTVPLVLGTAAADGTTVFSTKNTSAVVVTTIRGDGVPTADTDLTTKSYVDDSFNNLSLTRLVTDRTDIDGTKIVAGVINTGLDINLHNQTTNLNYALSSIPIGGRQTFTFGRGTGSSTNGTANCVVSITITAGSGHTSCVTQKVVQGSAFNTILSPVLLLESYTSPPSPSPTLYTATQALLSNVYTSAQPGLGYAGFTIYRLS